MSSFLLSEIIHNTTGIYTLDFVRENLFDPLGIGEVRWEWSPLAAYGSWTAPNTFEIIYQQIDYSTGAKFILTFDRDAITLEEFSAVGSYTYSGVMQ
jgi:CubicO group peptidase (beta-lactamase class C family)